MADDANSNSNNKRKAEEAVEGEPESKKQKREPKRKAVLVFGYNGAKYSGSQLQNGVKTIEEDLWAAIVKSGAVSKENASSFNKVAWQRSSRTDKGVHAAINIVAFKALIEDPNIVDKINENLPSEIRAYGFHRVTNSFNPRTYCDSRRYEYLLPTYAFKKRAPVTIPPAQDEVTTLSKLNSLTVDQLKAQNVLDLDFRLAQDDLKRINEILAKFIGNHCFWNFTHLEKNTHVSATFRKIFDFKASEPRVIDGVEFTVVTIHGSAFMIYQIRKMIGFLLAVFQGHYDISIFDKALSKTQRMSIPTAPSNGLLLDEMYYSGYNSKHISQQHGPLERTLFASKIDAMKENLYAYIAQDEKSRQPNARWMYILPYIVARHNGVHIPSCSAGGNVLDELQEGDDEIGDLAEDS